MKQFCTFLFLFAILTGSGQIADRTETNCEGESQSIYQIGDQGMPLIVASKGFDCSICQNQADDVRDFANQNDGNVAVWAAMTFTYSVSTPTCSNIDNWNTTHNWDETIFSFVDDAEYWVESGTPRYYVIHPTTREIIYEGFSFSEAASTALILSTSNTDKTSKKKSFRMYQSNDGIVMEKPADASGDLRVFNILGQEIFSQRISDKSDQVILDFHSKDGIYIANFDFGDVQVSTKFAFRR